MKTKPARFLVILLALGPVLSAVGHVGGSAAAAEDSLGMYTGNPYYWQYHGRPVLLLGGSSTPPGGLNDEGMFLWPNLPARLDRLKAAGGNYVRCLVSGRLRGETALWPFARKGDRYDLDQWDEEYWRLFETFLRETQARDIVTDIELWATFDYYREPWTKNPFNPKNNVNYTAEQTGLPLEVPSHPARAQNSFFRTLPELDNVAAVLKYQQRFVDKILSYTLRHNHVLYCMDNETAVSPKWGAYWARYVRAAAEKAGRRVPVTEMFDPHDMSDPMHGNVIDHPEVYSFIELAQNNHQKGETHYAKIMEVRRRVAASPRPLNNVKIYGLDGGQMGSSQEGMRRFWRNLFAGCASARFHEKHLGDSEPALQMIRSARLMTAAINLFRCQPHNDLLPGREPNQAYCLADPGKQYAVYFPAGGNVRLDLTGCAGDLELRWLDVDAARWSGTAQKRSVQEARLDAPGPGQWIAVLTASQGGAAAGGVENALPDVRIVPLPEGALVPDVMMDGAGVLHMVYGLGDDAWYVRSADNGRSFSSPVKVNTEGKVTLKMGERGPKLALGKSGSIHVVWGDQWSPGVKVYPRYSRSLDGGKTFEPPRALASLTGIDGLTVAADNAGAVVAFFHHVTPGQQLEVPQAHRLYLARSTDNGASFRSEERLKIRGMDDLACSMCMMRARIAADDNVCLALRVANDNIRDFFLLRSPKQENAFAPLRINEDRWELKTCPMCGPELTVDPAGRMLCAFMSRHCVYWSALDESRFRLHVATPAGENDEIYPAACGDGKGHVLLVWQVGPMAVGRTATVKWALYGNDGMFSGKQGTIGTSTSGSKATAFAGTDGAFYIVTTAK